MRSGSLPVLNLMSTCQKGHKNQETSSTESHKTMTLGPEEPVSLGGVTLRKGEQKCDAMLSVVDV